MQIARLTSGPLRYKPARPSGWPVILLAAMVALAAAALTLGAPSVLPAQEIVDIHGRLVNGTEGADVPGELGVLMLITGPDGTLSGTGQALAGADGSFVFDSVPVQQGAAYTMSVDYEGVFYSRALVPDQLSEDVTITVYEPTEDAGIIRVDRQVMVVSEIDVPERIATATEFVRFTNPTDQTLRPNLETARPGMFSFMRFALPPEAQDITVQSNLRGGEIVSVGSGLALTAAVPPGGHSVDFAYTFPYDGDEVEFRNSLPQGAGIFQVLVPERWPEVEIAGLTARPPVGIGNEVYRAWEGRDIPPGPGIQLKFDGLPQPGLLARVGSEVSGGPFWTTAIPSATGAVLLALLALGLFRRYRPATEQANEAPGVEEVDHADTPDERALIIARLADLDDRYQSGSVGHEEYLDQRASLVARALGERLESGV